nr:hypothetical protein B0A51_14155 [Rachicladosporium sp. CCFEE 5018]
MALSRHHTAGSAPMSVLEIIQQAEDFDFDPTRDLRSWLRAARMLLTEAALCEQDGNLQMAYLYLYRHAELVVGKLPLHPQIKDPKFKADFASARKIVAKSLMKLEQWKPRITMEHQRYVKAVERRNAERQRVRDERRDDQHERISSGDLHRLSLVGDEEAYQDLRETLNAADHRQLAVDLARQELRRRDVNRQSTRQAGISPHTVASRRQGMVLATPDDEDQGGSRGQVAGSRYDERLPRRDDRRPTELRQDFTYGTPVSQSYQYPSVPHKELRMSWDRSPAQPSRYTDYSAAPPLPAKGSFNEQLPPRPAKAGRPEVPAAATQRSAAQVTFKPNAYTEGGIPLRTVFLPPTLRTTFLNLAHSNTLRNLETCGILCGTLISNALFISHLIIPGQTSTSDTCDTTEEGDNALFDYCDSNDLLVCGWVHTHPSQSCFLSSRDLHTSSGYQIMLPEAIAIVCAPRSNPDWGIFRLTDPPGLPAVLGCHQRGLFHPHDESNLYTDALRPGHVVEGPGLKFETVDMRTM